MSPTEIEASIYELSIELEAIREKKSHLELSLRKAKSIAFIKKHNITKDMVMSYEGGWALAFDNIYDFAYWLKDTSDKQWLCSKWLCFNGFIYKTSKVLNDKVYLDPIARYEDL